MTDFLLGAAVGLAVYVVAYIALAPWTHGVGR